MAEGYGPWQQARFPNSPFPPENKFWGLPHSLALSLPTGPRNVQSQCDWVGVVAAVVAFVVVVAVLFAVAVVVRVFVEV